MSAIPLHIPANQDPDWSQLIAADEAAGILELNRNHLTRRCQTDLAARGLAALLTPPRGGQPKWFLHRSFDRRLLAGGLGELYREPDMSTCSARQRESALQKRACVDRFREALQKRRGLVKDWLPTLLAELEKDFPALKISKTTLYEWHKSYVRPADLVKLAGMNHGGDRKSTGDPASWQAFKGLYLHENGPTLEQCWATVRDTAEAEGWTWCTLSSCYAQLDTRIPPDTQLLHRNPVLSRQRLMPYIEQHPEGWAAGECGIGDHHQLNLWCMHGNQLLRPWLTAWMDWRTRRIAGWVLSDSPNSSTILAALRHVIQDERNLGGPGSVWIDNGKDYDCWSFHGQTKKERLARIKPAVDEPTVRGLFSMLQIEPHFSLAYNPNGKARLERWFGTLEPFYRTWETYCGNAPGKAPERLDYVLSKPGLIPSFKDVYERLKGHIQGDNASSQHDIDDLSSSGRRLSSDEAMALWCKTRRVLADPAALDLLMLQWHQPVTVGRNGISLSIGGQTVHYGQFAAELRPFKGLHKADRRPVRVSYDPHNLRTIRVYDEAFRFVSEASLNKQAGMHDDSPISVETVKRLSKEKAQYAKAKKVKAELSITSVLSTEERLAEIAAEQAQTTIAQAQPDTLKIIRTPVDGQAKAIERSQYKIAVGAGDAVPLPSMRSAIDLLTARRVGAGHAPPSDPDPDPIELMRVGARHASPSDDDDGFAADPWSVLRGEP